MNLRRPDVVFVKDQVDEGMGEDSNGKGNGYALIFVYDVQDEVGQTCQDEA